MLDLATSAMGVVVGTTLNSPADVQDVLTRLKRIGVTGSTALAFAQTCDVALVHAISDGMLVALVGGTLPTLPEYPGEGVPLGLPGALSPTRWVGGTTGGAPTTGKFRTGDWATAPDGIWYCTSGDGTSVGTWENTSSLTSAPDASTSQKGIVKLAGDLAGTATAPTVPGLAAKLAGTKSASAPSSPAVDDLWYDKTSDLWKRWNGSTWIPTGSATYAPKGASRAATFLVAAANSPAIVKLVADYVCTGTSSTGGDEVTINTAIAALPSAGGRVLLAEGTYYRSGPVKIDANGITLEGQGWGFNTVIQIATGHTSVAGVVVGYTHPVFQSGVKNLAIEGGQGAIQTGSGHGLLGIAASLIVENVNFQYIDGDPIHLTVCPPGAANGTLTTATTTSATTSLAVSALPAAIPAGTIVLVHPTDKTIRQNFTTSGAAQGATSIPITSKSPVVAFPIGSVATYWAWGGFPYLYEVSVKECTLNKCNGNGLFIDQYYGSCEFSLLHFDGGDDSYAAGAGILCCASETKFNHCHPYHFANGYQFGNSVGTCFPEQLTVIAGEAESNTYNGILLYNVLVASISDVMFYDNGTYDLHFGGGVHDVDVVETSSVVVNSSPTAYVKIDNGNYRLRFNGNIWSANPSTGITATGSSSVSYLKIKDNTIVTNSGDAVLLGTATHCDLVGNILTGNVTEASGANNNNIHDNDFLSGALTLTGSASQSWRNAGIANSPSEPLDVVVSLSGTTPTLVARVMNKITLSGNTTFALPTAKAGASFTCKVIQPGSGGPYTWTVTSADWGTAGAPTATTTASKADMFVGYCDDGSTWQLAAVGQGGF